MWSLRCYFQIVSVVLFSVPTKTSRRMRWLLLMPFSTKRTMSKRRYFRTHLLILFCCFKKFKAVCVMIFFLILSISHITLKFSTVHNCGKCILIQLRQILCFNTWWLYFQKITVELQSKSIRNIILDVSEPEF